jgi:uncharacterized delta-60 repeat protein
MKQIFVLLSFFFSNSIIHAQFNGSLDATFGANGKVTTSFARGHDAANAILVQPDGKILAAGHSSKDTLFTGPLSTNPQMALARYHPNGTLDNSFGTNGKVVTPFGKSSEINSMILQTDGKIIAVGYATDSMNIQHFALVRYNQNGTLDATFGENGKQIADFGDNSVATAVTIQTDNKIVVAGYYRYQNSEAGDKEIAMVRYLSSGKVDSTFNQTGKVLTKINRIFNDIVSSITLQVDGKIILCGSVLDPTRGDDLCLFTEPSDLFVIRYDVNGSLDNSFANNGIFINKNSEGSTIKVLNAGKILVSGSNYMTKDFLLMRLNMNGTIDATFNFDAPTSGMATDMVVQSDNKIIVVGEAYKNIDKTWNFKLVRCNSEGILDNTFGTNGKIVTPPVLPFERYSKIALQTDGKLVACGSSKNYGQFNFGLMRYNNPLVSTGTKAILADKNAYSVYPNPTNQALTIDVKTLNSSDINVKLVDMHGRIILQKSYSKGVSNSTLNIDIQYFTAGLYVLELTTAETKWAQLISKY